MGIRFYCPNGHKLNVKAFLAGKRGICPHCDARFDIPFESQIPDDAPRLRPVVSETVGSKATDEGELLGSVSIAVASPAELAVPSSTDDPIGDVPDAIWYVRPPGGGQYGPAQGDVMRRWVEEGRVSHECLVWREGWTDWKPAKSVFTKMDGETAPTTLEPPPEPKPVLKLESAAVTPDETEQVREVVRARRQSAGKGKSLAAIVFLGLLIVFLLVMLVVVLQQSA